MEAALGDSAVSETVELLSSCMASCFFFLAHHAVTLQRIGVELVSENLAIGGLLMIRLDLLSLGLSFPVTVSRSNGVQWRKFARSSRLRMNLKQVHHVRVILTQEWELISPSDASRVHHPPADEMLLCHLNGSTTLRDGQDGSAEEALLRRPLAGTGLDEVPLWTSSSNQDPAEVHLQHLVRLPRDDLLRPTTMPGTQGYINKTHAIQIQVEWQADRDHELKQVTTIRTLVQILSVSPGWRG